MKSNDEMVCIIASITIKLERKIGSMSDLEFIERYVLKKSGRHKYIEVSPIKSEFLQMTSVRYETWANAESALRQLQHWSKASIRFHMKKFG